MGLHQRAGHSVVCVTALLCLRIHAAGYRKVCFAAVRFCCGELIHCGPVKLIRSHSLADEMGVDEPWLVPVRSSLRLDNSNECLEKLNVVRSVLLVSWCW
jgi:hypothetical protein